MILKMILKILMIYQCMNMILVDSSDYCTLRCEDLNGANENIACKCESGSPCESTAKLLEPDEETKQYIVTLHNEGRQKIASGSTALPAAGNMRALAYAEDLQYTATCWAKQCLFEHDKCRRTKTFPQAGQNIFVSSGECDGKDVFKTAIDLWYGEISQAERNCIKSYSGCAGHFTQMIWATTTHVGCSRMLNTGQCLIACNYGPSGNILGSPVYLESSAKCDKQAGFANLCKSLKPITESGATKPAQTGNTTEATSASLKVQPLQLIVIIVTIIKYSLI